MPVKKRVVQTCLTKIWEGLMQRAHFSSGLCSALLCELFFFLLPLFWFLCLHFPFVFQVISFGLFRFFWPQTIVDFIFPSLSRCSYWSACFDIAVKSRIPLCYFSCPTFLGKRRNSQRHFPLHPSVSFYPTGYLCLRHVFFCLFCVLLMYSTQTSSSISTLSISWSFSS